MSLGCHGLVPALLSRGQWFKPWCRQPEKLLIWTKVHACSQINAITPYSWIQRGSINGNQNILKTRKSSPTIRKIRGFATSCRSLDTKLGMLCLTVLTCLCKPKVSQYYDSWCRLVKSRFNFNESHFLALKKMT